MYNNVQRKKDGTFVVDFNGLPFHVTPEYPAAERYGEEMTYGALSAYAEARPGMAACSEEAVMAAPSDEDIKSTGIAALENDASVYACAVQAGIDTEASRRRLVETMPEIEKLKGNID